MRELTSRHLNRLKELETQRFIDETIADMHSLHITPSYPEEESKYAEFVRLTLKAAQRYGLHTEKACYTYIMAWHIIGSEILKITWLQEILKSEEAFAEEKVEALKHASYEVLGEKENKNAPIS